MRRFSTAHIALGLALVAPVTTHAASLTVDGVAGTGEYAGLASVTRDSWVNGQNDANGFLTTTRYFSADDTHVYLAIVADVADPEWAGRLPFVNGYLYSSTGQNKLDGSGTGTYGTNDDLIIEGLNLNYARNGSGGVWGEAMPNGQLTQVSSDGGGTFVYSNSTYGVTVGLNHTTGVWEASVPRSLVNANAYDTLRFGGQAWVYGNTFNNFAVPAVTAPVPLPAAAFGALPLLAMLGLRRRR